MPSNYSELSDALDVAFNSGFVLGFSFCLALVLMVYLWRPWLKS